LLELAVTSEKNNNVLYLKYVPMPAVEDGFPIDYDPKLCLQADAHLLNFKGYCFFYNSVFVVVYVIRYHADLNLMV